MITGRIGAFNENVGGDAFGANSVPVLPVAVVDGTTGSPLGLARNSSANGRPPLRWEQAPSLRDRLVQAISQDDQTGAPLLLELDALEKRIHAYLRSKQEEQALDLRAELAEITAKGKAAVERVRQATEARNIAQGVYNSHLEEVVKSRKNLAAVKAAAPSDDDFATEEEVSEHAAKLSAAQARHDAVTAHSKRLNAAMQQAQAEAKQAERDLAAIKARRSELRDLLGGGSKRPSAIAGLGPIGLQG